MLAYSSIENMGILFIGISLGAPGIFAAMLHTVAHSLSKASLFLTSGIFLISMTPRRWKCSGTITKG